MPLLTRLHEALVLIWHPLSELRPLLGYSHVLMMLACTGYKFAPCEMVAELIIRVSIYLN